MRQWRFLALAFLILTAAFALRLHHLNTESIWHDEAWSIRAFRGPFTTPDDNTPYLYYLSGHVLWRAGAGETPLALRYVSVLFGLLTVAASLRIGRRWLGITGSVVFAAMVAASPLLWEYAQEVRAYVVVPLIALSMIAVSSRILRFAPGASVPRKLWMAAFAVQVIGLYTHNLSVPLVVWLNAALGLPWLLRRDWRKMLTWSTVEIAVIVAYIPWLLTQSPSGTPLNSPPQPGFDLAREVWLAYFFPVPAQVAAVQSDVLLMLLAAGVGLSVIVASIYWLTRFALKRTSDSTYGWLLASHALLVPALSTALMIAASIDYHPRYYIAAVPGTLLLLAFSMHRLPAIRVRQIAYGALVFGVLTLSFAGIQQVLSTRSYQHDDFAALADYYATLPEDAVILIPFDVERALQDYFVHHVEIDAEFVNMPLYSDEATTLAAINALVQDAPRHIELLTWFQLPADVRSMVPCLLAAGSDHIEPPQTFFGLSTQAFSLTQRIEMQPLDQDATIAGIVYHGGAVASAPAGTCLRTNWSLTESTTEDFRVAATMRSPFDTELARDDTPIARDDNAEPSAWQTGDNGAAYALLTPPANAPPQTYTVTFGVYSVDQPSGLDVLDPVGAPAGKVVRVDDVLVAGGPRQSIDGETRLVESSPSTEAPIESGQMLGVTLLLVDDADAIMFSGDGWQETQPVTASQRPTLSWHRVRIPPDVDGTLTLTIAGLEIASWQIVNVTRLFEQPPVETPVNAEFPGVGQLVGVTLPDAVISGGDFTIDLIWQASEQGDVADYTVFVQFISPDGRVIAQSDSPPAAGSRPTSGWIAGEYIEDTHTLRFNVVDYSGETTLIAGLYDPTDDFRRVLTDAGADFATVPGTITVNP